MKKVNTASYSADLPQLDLIGLTQTQFCERFKSIIQDPNTAVGTELSLNQVRLHFFVNHSWRLTKTGFNILSRMYRSYTMVQPLAAGKHEILNGRVLLNIDTCINSPWFIRNCAMVVWDPVVHFELTMIDGDLDRFISFKLENVR